MRLVLRGHCGPATALLLLAIPLAAGAADAQEVPRGPSGTFFQLDPLDITGQRADGLHLTVPSTAGSRLGLTPLQTPASVEVLSGETVRDRNETTVNQAVSRATGFTAIPTPGNGENGVSVRGFTGVGSVTQLLDGTQLYVGSGTTTFPFDTWSIDRIDILNGAGTLLYGTGAVGGVINVVSREPDPTGFHNEARLSVGSFDTFGEQIHSTGPISPKASYKLDLSNFDSAGYVHRGNSSSTALSGALRVDPTPTLSIVLSDDYGFQRPMNYLGTPLVKGMLLPGLRYDNYDAADGRVQYTDNFLQAKATWTPTDAVTGHNDAYLLTDQRLFREIDYYTYQPATNLLQVSDHREVYHHQTQYGDHGDLA